MYGWSGELNLRYTLETLFKEPFGIGHPIEDAKRKKEDTKLLKILIIYLKYQ
jgi:predicted acetyltransferase